jgi:hypothetical protein
MVALFVIQASMGQGPRTRDYIFKDLTLKERNLIIDILKAEDIHFETS